MNAIVVRSETEADGQEPNLNSEDVFRLNSNPSWKLFYLLSCLRTGGQHTQIWQIQNHVIMIFPAAVLKAHQTSQFPYSICISF